MRVFDTAVDGQQSQPLSIGMSGVRPREPAVTVEAARDQVTSDTVSQWQLLKASRPSYYRVFKGHGSGS